ncbi:MAG TPA: transposase [Pseudonocardiaceae bacterium]|nr:transposase [Pseudonocardiaceae bacterium]
MNPLQRLLEGMPSPRPPLSVHNNNDGGCVVLAGPVVVFGPYEPGDLGMRNLGVVTLTQLGFAVGAVAAAFGIQPGYASTLRTRFREHGSAGLVAVSGRKAVLTVEVVATARGLLEQGWSRGRVADRFGVGPSALSKALSRHPAPVEPVQTELEVRPGPDGARDAPSAPGADTDTTGHGADTTTEEDTNTADDSIQDTAAEADRVDHAEEAGRVEGADRVDQAEGAGGSVVAPRITEGVFPSRYAGAMLAYAYLDRIGACGVLTGLPETPWRRFDQAQIACHTVLALLLGVGSIEQVKTLWRAQAGPLTGTLVSPELHTLRPRLSTIADKIDVLALQRTLATAMLALAGESAGVYYVDDHFVPYSGAKPVAMGHNGKRGRCEKGRADTLITDARGRAVCFTTGEPSHLSKTMQPALDQLRQIIPEGKIMLGFDRGGAYAEAFTACRERGIDFLTYRRGTLADHTTGPRAHTATRVRDRITVHLAEELIDFPGYQGPCRQLTLFEPDADGDLVPVLQVLTSDLEASAPDLLVTLKGRWVIENTFKYLGFYGIDWLLDYHAEITANTKLINNPTRTQANTAIRAAKANLAEAQRALGELLNSGLSAAEKNTTIPNTQQAVTHHKHNIATLITARNKIPTQLPANQIDPNAQRALLHAHRRAFLMTLRLLAYNTDTWLADHLNTYLHDPNEYRAIMRSLMHHGGTITYTPQAITVTLDRHDTPRVNRALTCLTDELNTTPAHMPGDPRPITYQPATR